MTTGSPSTIPRGGSWPVAVLGATGAVGQTFVRLLEDHPWFHLADVGASERSVDRAYGDAVHWLEGDCPEGVARMTVKKCAPSQIEPRIVFSALDSSVAGPIEEEFARAGAIVFTNAKNHRMDEDVPLVIPEINPSHMDLIPEQRSRRGWTGAIVANANCAAIGAALPLAALHEAFDVKQAFVFTMQAVSGAGYPGVPSLDVLGNVVPFIPDEESKIEEELRKILGRMGVGEVAPAAMTVSASANRVPVHHGHTINLCVALSKPASAEECAEVFRGWRGQPAARGLPSSPDRPIVVDDRLDRPQPKRDVDAGQGMAVTIGRVRPDPIFNVKLVALSHNTVRGAAGASLLNAELLASMGTLAS